METSQKLVDEYADLIGDGGPIHNDPDSPAAIAMGGTIVQGTYMLGSLPRLAREIGFPTKGIAYRLHYGYDRIRLVRPVPTGSRFRARFRVEEVRPRGDDAEVVHFLATIEVEGRGRPHRRHGHRRLPGGRQDHPCEPPPSRRGRTGGCTRE